MRTKYFISAINHLLLQRQFQEKKSNQNVPIRAAAGMVMTKNKEYWDMG
jgi:hypothetical protein